MFSRGAYEKAATEFFQKDENQHQFFKYQSADLLTKVCQHMSLPTAIAAEVAFNKLVQTGKLQRTDGGNAETDQAAAVARAIENVKKIKAEIDSRPWTRQDFEYLQSLPPRELSRLYFGEDGSACNEFAFVYRRAMAEWMFKEPLRYEDTPPMPSWAEGLV